MLHCLIHNQCTWLMFEGVTRIGLAKAQCFSYSEILLHRRSTTA